MLLALAAAVSLHRIITPNWWMDFHTGIRLDALLVPAALAVLLRTPLLTSARNRQRLLQTLRVWPLLAIGLLVVITLNTIARTTGLLVVWLTPFLILATMIRPQSWFGRLLEYHPYAMLAASPTASTYGSSSSWSPTSTPSSRPSKSCSPGPSTG